MSPRSLILAIKRAAERSAEQYESHSFALHYEAIHAGVAAASTTRVDELAEDYPWVKSLLEAARGLSVPCSPDELKTRWPLDLLKDACSPDKKLAPRRFTTDPLRKNTLDSVVDDLVELGVLYRTQDRRLNIPDIFRVGFGIRRKGGVRPTR